MEGIGGSCQSLGTGLLNVLRIIASREATGAVKWRALLANDLDRSRQQFKMRPIVWRFSYWRSSWKQPTFTREVVQLADAFLPIIALRPA